MSQFKKPLLAFVSVIALGCESPELSDSATATATSTQAPAPAEPEQELVAGIPGPALPDDEIPITDVPREVDPKDPVKGRRTRETGGVAGNFGAALWAKHKAMFDAIDYANQLYAPQHDFSYPKSHEEFMTAVVAPALNGELLPELPEYAEYIYVPEQGELGLQIRLVPGGERSKIDAPEPGKEHVYDPEILAAAGVVIPPPDDGLAPNGEPLSPDPRERAEQLRQRDEANAAAAAGEPAAPEEPSPNIGVRAGQIGELGNANIESALGEGDN